MEDSRSQDAFQVAILLLFGILLAAASPAAELSTDRSVEKFLLKASVVQIHMVMTATTYPMAVDLESKREVRRAMFKYGHHEGPPRDSYLHEVAAYRLDRALDLHMVPVSVVREIKTPGALIEWVDSARSVEDLRAENDLRLDSRALLDQQAVMAVFDALISNSDRKESDQLVTADGGLHLIDHSRAFQTLTELPEEFVAHPCRLPKDLEKRLAKLEAKPLTVLFEGLLDEEQIRAVLERRDRILDKIAADRETLGETAVYMN